MERLRFLYTVNRMDVGGSQTHLVQVLRLLDRRRFEPMLCCLSGKARCSKRQRDRRHRHWRRARAVESPAAAGAMMRLARFIRRERVDIVQTTCCAPTWSYAGGTGRASALVLTSKRGCHHRRGFELAGARLSNWLADCVTTNAAAVRAFVHEDEGCPLERWW
jgi:hypothetical protein